MSAAVKTGREFSDGARRAMLGLFEAARAIDIRHFEEASSAEVAGKLSAGAISLVQRAVELATAILDAYDTPRTSSSPSQLSAELNFELAIDSVLSGGGEQKIADLAFMAVSELRQRGERLKTHSPASDAWEMVCDCGSALRRVQKSLGALELAICEVENLPRALSFDSELETSRQVRRQYAKLWRFCARTGEVDATTVRNALRGAGTLCAMLVGRDVYCRLRERDRYQLRQLQRRVLGWLVQDPADPKAGVRIWEDWAGFVEMLRQVNLRQELVQHDSEALRIAETALSKGAVSEGTLALLRQLDGLDDELDAALCPSRDDAPALLGHVRRVRARFLPAAPPPANAELF
jgi:hypothetical protein